MKITAVRSVVVDAVRTNYVFAVIETDAGITGVGEGTVELNERVVAVAIDETGGYLVGEDPFAVERHVARLNRDGYWRGGVILRSAIGAVEAAMLDIKGKALGVPVYELLGGAFRTRIPAYANGWFTGSKTPDQFAKAAAETVAQGFRALKWDPFGSAYGEMEAAELAASMTCVSAVREAVGPEIDLMIEGHGRFNLPTALRLAELLAEHNPKWFEEPLPPESLAAYATLCRHAPIPIATGERYCTPAQFSDLLDRADVAYVQPDVVHVGGLTALKAISGMAYARFCPTAPHNPAGPVAHAMSVQAAAASEGIVILECMISDVSWRADIASEAARLVNGYIEVPNVPGLGVSLNEVACLQYPFSLHRLRHFTGELTDIRPSDAVPLY